MNPIRVMLVDDHKVVRVGARALLDSDSRFEVVGEAVCGEDALRLVQELQPDVVLLDLKLPDGGGADLCRRLLKVSPRTAVLILTAFVDWSLVDACLKAGARGYLLKSTEYLHLQEKILAVVQGQAALDPAAAEVVAEHMRQGGLSTASLTSRETEIVVLMSQGLTNREIGERLCLSENTIKSHVKDVLSKLNARNRLEAVLMAKEQGFI